MPSSFDRLFEACARPVMDAVFGVSIKLHRGATASVAFVATYSTREVEVAEEGGAVTVVTHRGWLLQAADCVISGSPVVPRRGDRIAEQQSGETWEITPPDNTNQAVELQDGNYAWLANCQRVVKPTGR